MAQLQTPGVPAGLVTFAADMVDTIVFGDCLKIFGAIAKVSRCCFLRCRWSSRRTARSASTLPLN
jgi:hypothetical protein